jgi:2-keto-4-pentenoate hydratase/2-oxohepta-3-ene-1,7-dioic acid hydratase in catechol pathway
MKLSRFAHDDEISLGWVDSSTKQISGIADPGSQGDPTIAVIRSTVEGRELSASGEQYELSNVRLLPPIAQPSKNILCIGKNYREHAAEFARSGFDSSATNAAEVVPEAPIIFSKAPGTMVGANDLIRPPWNTTSTVDYEGELGVVIGVGGRSISVSSAYDHVWGYTVINDVTARDLQAAHKQWLLGKSIDTFCPIGPWIVTADELDPENLDLKCWVNDELRQDANTRDLIFDIPAIIACISASMTLNPGDIIATGTPAGVGIGFDPPKFLKPGDTVRIVISGIGEIENQVA